MHGVMIECVFWTGVLEVLVGHGIRGANGGDAFQSHSLDQFWGLESVTEDDQAKQAAE